MITLVGLTWWIITTLIVIGLEYIHSVYLEKQCINCLSYRTENINQEFKCWNCGEIKIKE